jgi:hypothetical protein
MPLWAQFVIMIYTGLLGGAMYVNTFYLLVSDAKLTGKVTHSTHPTMIGSGYIFEHHFDS